MVSDNLTAAPIPRLTTHRDQELRFTVHDSPDYYQLKVSLFNDDKKTEIIGETWVNLQEVIVPGGGQNDLWHNLSCRGKYAGEIRIEITYYDTRPKEERPEKIKQAGINGADDGARDGLRGPRQPKAAPKRRPLPSDPVTGAPPPEPVEQPPPRGYQPATAIPDHVQTPPRGYPSPSAVPGHVQPSPRGYHSPTALPDHVQTPPRGYQSPSYISSQSPLQNVEYNTPSHRPQSHGYGAPGMAGYGTSPGTTQVSPMAQPLSDDRHEIYEPQSRNDYTQRHGMEHYEEQEELNPPYGYSTQQPLFDIPEPHEYHAHPGPDDQPPPPPVHRSMNGSQQVNPAPVMPPHAGYNFPSDPRPASQYEPQHHDAHRRSMPAYTNSNSREAYDLAANDQFRKSADQYDYEQSAPRHHSYDSRYNELQPTVEDAPPTPAPANYSEQHGGISHGSHFDEGRYDPASTPAPLNLSGRGSAASGHYVTNGQTHQYSNGPSGYRPNSATTSFTENVSPVSPLAPHNGLPQQTLPQGRQLDDRMPLSSDNYGLPQMPPSLVPGMDPTIAQEISDRIYSENRASKAANPPRARYDSPQYQPPRAQPISYQQAPAPSPTAAATYEEHQSRFSAGTTAPTAYPRGASPDTRTPIRKSVSPSPGPSPDTRRLSGVPFGPDSYNALNPSLAGSISTTSLSARYDPKEVDPDAKIITHDGREVDPSDHIPESNYAPLLETKAPKYASQLPDRNYRPSPTQPNPSPGRKQLRQAGRPQSMAASSPIYMGQDQPDPSTPTGRHRLQKKSNRMSAQPAPHSSPLAPITPYQNNSYTPRSLPRGSATDYPNENYAPPVYGSSPGHRGSAGPPPIPAKVPVAQYAPAPQDGSGDPWALLEEMKNIDLGSGRARRRY